MDFSSFMTMFQTIVVLIIVIILANISLKLINRNFQMKGKVVKIIEKTPISNNSSLAVVKIINSYYLMSFSEKENSILKELGKEEVDEILLKADQEDKFIGLKEKYEIYMEKRGKRD
ncbi:MAG: flagellar biosynthetic protein FliO [Gudongella sp.]|nr:flagellar biosynthetic protein FliO [Gudongella sp.]